MKRVQWSRASWFPAVLLSGALLAGCEGDTVFSPEGGVSAEDRISVTGEASITVEPDIASAQVGVQTFAGDAVSAVTDNNTATAAVIAAVGALGVAENDLETRAFSISPQRDFREGRPDSVIGFWVSNTIDMTVRDLSTVGNVLQAAVEAGANTIYGLQFTVARPDSVEDLARTKAVEDARRRAETLAAAAGVRVGDVVSLRENSVTSPYYYRGAYDEADAAGVPVEAGDVEVSAVVEVVFEID